MNCEDYLLLLLIEFFELPPHAQAGNITQKSIPAWDSLAMVQLVTELEEIFSVEFDLEQIRRLRSYQEIWNALNEKGVLV